MKSIEDIREILNSYKESIRREYGVVIVGIFGSYARGEQNIESDIDILVELERPIGLRFFELWNELEKLLDAKVDLITVSAAKQKPMFWKKIEEDLISV